MADAAQDERLHSVLTHKRLVGLVASVADTAQDERLRSYFGTTVRSECARVLRSGGLSKRQAERKLYLIMAGNLEEAEKIHPTPSKEHLECLGVTVQKRQVSVLTHKRLVALVAKRFVLQGYTINLEVRCGNRRADLVVSKDNYAIAFEIKVSLPDFLNDACHAEKRRPAMRACNEFWYVVPAWLPISEVPLGCGLLVCDLEERFFIRQGITGRWNRISPSNGDYGH